MLDFHNRITNAGLTPNGYFAVLLHLLDINTKTLIELNVEFRRLKKAGFLTEGLSPTQKLLDTGLFEDLEIKENEDDKRLNQRIGMFISKFPAKLPDGRYPRSTVSIVKQRFKDFFSEYDYGWEVIYKAAESYVNAYAAKNYEFMRNAPNFVFKDGESLLALECEEINNETEKAPWDIDI